MSPGPVGMTPTYPFENKHDILSERSMYPEADFTLRQKWANT